MAHVQFTDVQDRPTEFLDVTSLTLDEFQQLVPPFEAAFQAHMAAWCLDGKRRTARQFAVDKNCPLPTPEDRLLFILAYIKTYALQVVQGRLFGMGQSKANQWMHVLLPVLLAALTTGQARAAGDDEKKPAEGGEEGDEKSTSLPDKEVKVGGALIGESVGGATGFEFKQGFWTQSDLGGFFVRRALPSAQRRMVGPFIFFDHMGPAEFRAGQGIDVRKHPHIGLATVTYLFDGGIFHRDSLGYAQAIRPGDVNWMTAGRGIAHSERTEDDMKRTGFTMHGVQTWVALPKPHEETAPAFEHVPASKLPAWSEQAASLRLIVGSYAGRREEIFPVWKASIQEIARCENVVVKLGGLAMCLLGYDFHLRPKPPSSEEAAAAWRPYIETCIEAFGPNRCMFESNFPPDKGQCSYQVIFNAFKRLAAQYGEAEKTALFSKTATDFYKLELE